MSVILKTYAVTGENELHRHPVEDHLFVVLKGEAESTGRTEKSGASASMTASFCPAPHIILSRPWASSRW
jgi:hypothetical protein